MFQKHRKYRKEGTLKIRNFIKNSITDNNKTSFEEIYQISENFVYLNETKRVNKKIFQCINKYISKYLTNISIDIKCTIQKIISFNFVIERLNKCFLALYPLISKDKFGIKFLYQCGQKYIKFILNQYLEDLKTDITLYFRIENTNKNLCSISDLEKVFDQFGLCSEYKDIIIYTNVQINSCHLDLILTADAYENTIKIANYFAERRKIDFLSKFLYEIEQKTLQPILLNVEKIDKKFFANTKEFYDLYTYYFTADMKSNFFQHIAQYLNDIEIAFPKIQSLELYYIFVMITLWIIKNTEYNAEVVIYLNKFLGEFINKNSNMLLTLVEALDSSLNCMKSIADDNYILVHMMNPKERDYLRNYSARIDFYLQDYFVLQSEISTGKITNIYFKLTLDIFYYTLNNLENNERFLEAYQICLTKRLLMSKSNILEEQKIIENYKKIAKYNYFYNCERIIKEYNRIEVNHNAEIYLYNAFIWNLPEISDFTPNKEITKSINIYIGLKDTEKFKYRFAWDFSSCEIEVNGQELLMSVFQYHIIQYVMEFQPTEKDLYEYFKSCNINIHIDELMKNELLIYKNEKIYLSTNLNPKVKNIIPAYFDNLYDVFKKKDEINKQNFIRTKIILSIKREKSIDKKRLIELITKTLNLLERDVELNLEALKQNGEIVEQDGRYIIYNND